MNNCLLRLYLPLHSLLECLHCTIALHCSGCPSLLRLPLHNSARRKIYNPSSSSLLHLSYNLPCSIFLTFTRLSTFARSSALYLHADKSSGRWLCYCMEIQFFSPGFCCGLCQPLLPAVLTTIVLSLFSLRCIPPIPSLDKSRRLYPQPRSRISNLEVPLSDRPSLRPKCLSPTLIRSRFRTSPGPKPTSWARIFKLPSTSTYGWR